MRQNPLFSDWECAFPRINAHSVCLGRSNFSKLRCSSLKAGQPTAAAVRRWAAQVTGTHWSSLSYMTHLEILPVWPKISIIVWISGFQNLILTLTSGLDQILQLWGGNPWKHIWRWCCHTCLGFSNPMPCKLRYFHACLAVFQEMML